MTPQEQAFWRRAQNRASMLSPEIAAAMLRAFVVLREILPEAQLAQIIAAGNVEVLMRTMLSDPTLDSVFLPVREKIRSGVASNIKYFARDIPRGNTPKTLTVAFDSLNPRIIDAVRSLDTRVINTLKGDVRETVRAFVENGLRDGVNPRAVARQLHEVVGLAPHQEKAVANFQKALETGDLKALSRKLRDKRFDRTLRKALGKDGTGLSPEQIKKMTDIYRKRMIAHNAETNARTAALDSMKLGQRLSMEDAIAKGVYTREKLMKQWSGVMDSRERPEHRAMEGEIVHFDQPFSNGQIIPGETDYNCRCFARYFEVRN